MSAKSLLRTLSTKAAATTPRRPPPTIANYAYFLPFQTRWNDNDSYAHMNNVVYNAYGDSIVNEFLITHLGLSLPSSSSTSPPTPVGLMVNATFSFHSPLTYPQPLLAALSVSNVTRSSITWQTAIFSAKYLDPISPASTSGDEGEGGELSWSRRVGLVEGKEQKASAWGSMTHVFVDEKTRKATSIPEEWREKLKVIMRDWE